MQIKPLRSLLSGKYTATASSALQWRISEIAGTLLALSCHSAGTLPLLELLLEVEDQQATLLGLRWRHLSPWPRAGWGQLECDFGKNRFASSPVCRFDQVR